MPNEPNYRVVEGDIRRLTLEVENIGWKPLLMAPNGKPGEAFVIFERIGKS